jgi:riboflavin synthase
VERREMFTGIVEEIGRVQSVSSGGLVIRVSRELADLRVSDSISVNGACLTVTSRDEDSFSVDVVPETLRRTNLGALRAGDPVDLERSLAVDGRFGGHVVQGHVDATGAIESVAQEGEALLLRFRAPPSIMRYVVEKGFIAVDGVSLTVVDCDDRSFSVTVIPFTRDNTILGSKAAGDAVNLEADIMAKYVERLLPGPQGR